MTGPVKYTKEVIKEGKRVRWPKKEAFLGAFITVIVVAGLFAAFISIEDLAAGTLIQQLKDAFEGWNF